MKFVISKHLLLGGSRLAIGLTGFQRSAPVPATVLLRRAGKILLLLSACVAAGATVPTILRCGNVPRYSGKDLREWLALSQTEEGSAKEAQAKEAVRSIGTNALPLLIEWIEIARKPRDDKLLHLINKLPRRLAAGILRSPIGRTIDREQRARSRGLALTGFSILGSAAKPALPRLTHLLDERDPDTRMTAGICAVSCMGTQGLPFVLMGLRSQPERRTASYYLAAFQDAAGKADLGVEDLVSCLKTGDDFIAAAAARALGELAIQPEVAVPALVEALRDQRWLLRSTAARALCGFETEARRTAPLLIAALRDPDRRVRKSAATALLKIAPEVLGKRVSP